MGWQAGYEESGGTPRYSGCLNGPLSLAQIPLHSLMVHSGVHAAQSAQSRTSSPRHWHSVNLETRVPIRHPRIYGSGSSDTAPSREVRTSEESLQALQEGDVKGQARPPLAPLKISVRTDLIAMRPNVSSLLPLQPVSTISLVSIEWW